MGIIADKKLFKEIYSKYNAINEENINNHNDFYEVVLNDEKLFSYFNQLKELEKKHSFLFDVSDNEDSFRKKIFAQLKNVYKYLLIDIYKNNKETKLEKLKELNSDIERSIGHGFDSEIDFIKKDLTEKINHYKHYRIVTNNNNEEYLELFYDDADYKLPSIDLLDFSKKINNNQDQIEKNINILEEVFDTFKVKAKIISVTIGPFFTQYEVELEKGEKVSKLTGIKNEISLALAKGNINIEVPIQGKNTCGINIDNDYIENINLKEVIEKIPKNNDLLVALGKDIYGKNKFFDVVKSPHVLIAGSTGTGKSICIKSIITSLLLRLKPNELKLILIDPKRIELSLYNGLPHLICPVVTDPKKGVATLQKIVLEMEHRYDIFDEQHVKDIDEYNKLIKERNKTLSEDNKLSIMPFIVIVIDEIADLVSVAKDDFEDTIINIVKMARPVGIHIIISTQLPNASFVSRIVKTNIPTRIAFDVPSGNDSRAILGINGAERLRGGGDMLFLPPKSISPIRIRGTFISDSEIDRVVNFICKQQVAQYDSRFTNLGMVNCNQMVASEKREVEEEDEDPLYDEIVEFVVKSGKASASILQRRFKLGYNRAARVIDLLEERGIIGPMNGSEPREVLIKLNNSDSSIDDELI